MAYPPANHPALVAPLLRSWPSTRLLLGVERVTAGKEGHQGVQVVCDPIHDAIDLVPCILVLRRGQARMLLGSVVWSGLLESNACNCRCFRPLSFFGVELVLLWGSLVLRFVFESAFEENTWRFSLLMCYLLPSGSTKCCFFWWFCGCLLDFHSGSFFLRDRFL